MQTIEPAAADPAVSVVDDADPAAAAAEEDRPTRKQRLAKSVAFWLLLGGLVAGVLWSGLMVSVVKTGSMRPGIQPGDAVVSISAQLVHPHVGSIIVVEPKVAGQDLPAIAHRIIRINPDGSYTTKGDYNPEPDAWKVNSAAVKSTVIAHVPMGWTRSPLIVAAGLGVLALVFLWPSSKSDGESSADDDAGSADGSAQEEQDLIDLRDSGREPAGTSAG